MISFVCRAREYVGDSPADDRSDDAEHDRPEDRHVHVHHRFRNNPGDEPNENVPDPVKHTFSALVCFRNVAKYNPGVGN